MGKTAGYFWLSLSIMFFFGVIFLHWGSIILAFATLAAAYFNLKDEGIDLRTKLGIPRPLNTNEEVTLCPTCGIDNLAVAISCRKCGKPLLRKTPLEIA